MATIADALQDVVADVASDELDLLAAVTHSFYGSDISRRATVRGILLGKGRDAALGFGAVEAGQLVASLALIILNGVATNVLSGYAEHQINDLGRWLASRRLARQLTSAAPAAEATPLPKLTPGEAAAVGELARQLAHSCGLSTDTGTRLSITLAAKLMEDPTGQ
ncbi:hypothetical protein ACN27J_09745 [Solwaraspora sp. WMMB762]|uniref:hypothetical protein n=1 Tax=Solwaraspora sp. WMMB762 TaxID=3404120 RepID=UPI003B93AEBE